MPNDRASLNAALTRIEMTFPADVVLVRQFIAEQDQDIANHEDDQPVLVQMRLMYKVAQLSRETHQEQSEQLKTVMGALERVTVALEEQNRQQQQERDDREADKEFKRSLTVADHGVDLERKKDRGKLLDTLSGKVVAGLIAIAIMGATYWFGGQAAELSTMSRPADVDSVPPP